MKYARKFVPVTSYYSVAYDSTVSEAGLSRVNCACAGSILDPCRLHLIRVFNVISCSHYCSSTTTLFLVCDTLTGHPVRNRVEPFVHTILKSPFSHGPAEGDKQLNRCPVSACGLASMFTYFFPPRMFIKTHSQQTKS